MAFATDEARLAAALVPEYGPHTPRRQCGCADRLSELEQEIEDLHRLFWAGEICEPTYRLHLRQMEAQLAILGRAF